jgi:hypothetical protein
MAEHAKPIDISNIPELLQLAEEVHRSHEPRVLRRNTEDLAMVVPLPRTKKADRHARAKTEEDIEAFHSAAGSWADVDTDKLIADIYATRRRSNRPPVEL